MPNYIFEMSTDADIRNTNLNARWNPFTRYTYPQVQRGGLNIPAGSTIVVIAHGSGTEIGNATPGTGADINAETV